jgi:hypothetical protein
MRIVAFIIEPRVIQKILQHLAAMGADGCGPPGSTERRPTAASRLRSSCRSHRPSPRWPWRPGEALPGSPAGQPFTTAWVASNTSSPPSLSLMGLEITPFGLDSIIERAHPRTQ